MFDIRTRQGINFDKRQIECFNRKTFVFLQTSNNKNMENGFKSFDNHCHTEFAFCSAGVTIEAAVEKAGRCGMEYVAFTEHAGHLYFSRQDCWKSLYEPEFLNKSNMKKTNRMEEYKKAVRQHAPLAKIGYEADAAVSGKINLLQEDRVGIDILLGGIHFLFRHRAFLSCPAKKTEELFMRTNEALCREKIDVLAHPFRFFRRNNLPVPGHLYKPLAQMLKTYGVAAELNFHSNNQPDPAFFETCLALNVRISPGSDSHAIEETGDFSRHAEFLKKIGVNRKNFGAVAFNLNKKTGDGKNEKL